MPRKCCYWCTLEPFRHNAGQIKFNEKKLGDKETFPSSAGEWQGQEVAVKVQCSQDKRLANFEGLPEYLVSKKVRHPNVVRPFAHGCIAPAVPSHSALC